MIRDDAPEGLTRQRRRFRKRATRLPNDWSDQAMPDIPDIPFELLLSTAVTTVTALIVTSLYRTLSKYIRESLSWRDDVNGRLDSQAESLMGKLDEQADAFNARMDEQADRIRLQTKAQQTTMRATLIHNAEKYIERNWITPEERASWYDMHEQYSKLGANGLIDSYKRKLDGLPDKILG